MQLTNDLSKCLATAVLSAALSTAAGAQDCERLWATDHELWIDDGSETRLAVSDLEGAHHARWSPSGERIAYAHEFRFGGSLRSQVIVVDNDGRRLHALPIPAASEVNAILQVGWRDDQHPFIEGHVNPSTSVYMEWHLGTGALVDQRPGSWFAVSPDGRFVAHRAHVPHGAPPPHDSTTLVINGRTAYPPAGDTAYHRFVGELSWSADSEHLALIDRAAGDLDLVVIDPQGDRITRIPLADVAEPHGLSWSGKAILIQTRSGSWRADPASGSLDRVVVPPKASQAAAPSPALTVRLSGAKARLIDRRCGH